MSTLNLVWKRLVKVIAFLALGGLKMLSDPLHCLKMLTGACLLSFTKHDHMCNEILVM